MPIRVKCPKCHKFLTAKDHLAGKKVSCPVCKGPILIPMPAAPAEDIEALAAAALAGPPPAAAPAAAVTGNGAQEIVFTCKFCDAEVRAPRDMAGKKTPCPDCKRILSVPQLQEEKPKDWRQVETRGPAFAKRDEPAPPDGAWDTRATRVSQESLEEAGVVVEEQEPFSPFRWVKRGLWAAAVVTAVVVAWVVFRDHFSATAQARALASALEHVKEQSSLSPGLKAEVLRAAGELYLLQKEAAKANKSFREARDAAKAGAALSSAEHDLFLIDLALSQAELGGDGEAVVYKQKLEWDDVFTELDQSLRQIGSADAMRMAVRVVGQRLSDRNKSDLALNLATKLKNKDPGADGAPPPLAARQIALLLVTGNKESIKSILPPPGKDGVDKSETVRRLGHAEGYALLGKFDEARKEAEPLGPQQQLEACVAVASAALALGKVEEAKQSVEDALKLDGQMKEGAKAPAALQLQLARLAAGAGLKDRAKAVADAIADKAYRAAAQRELLTLQLRESTAPVEVKAVEEHIKDRDTLAFAQGMESVARHNTRVGAQGATEGEIAQQEERFRPLMHVGVALGIQDGSK